MEEWGRVLIKLSLCTCVCVCVCVSGDHVDMCGGAVYYKQIRKSEPLHLRLLTAPDPAC